MMQARWFLGLLSVAMAMMANRTAAAPMSWLRADGTRIVDERGRTVELRGINLGGWLVEEMWMMPFETKPPEGSDQRPIKDHVSLWAVLEDRFGPEGAQRLKTALRNAWISDADFDRIKAAGFNCVRLPFLYDLLSEPDGWKWLDDAVDRASRRGIYVILDLHGAPGRQSKDHHTGEEGVNRLFSDPEMVTQTEEVWSQVARHFRAQPAVAGYDLLNEPMGAPDAKAMFAVLDRLYGAVRSADPRHMVFIEEAYKGLNTFPLPESRGWKNVVYSAHMYQFEAKTEQDHLDALHAFEPRLVRLQRDWQVPFYLGEFNLEPHTSAETMAAFLKTLRANGWSWSIWTYKVVMPRAERSMWGLYRDSAGVDPLNPYKDSEADLIKKMDQVRTEKLEEYPGLADAYRAAGR